ncbi:hypothetical protein [Rhizobium paknamense]|uniref:Uncharacterized protein n=1 Tax=Rhizobium paknamense TaxID=1206817 RepID=A0ABU0I6U4_9HYPH|nr:hypothetical protein [Rhizobium paknamense]MDQ0453949.1 hypothetical protein [Rhizobium paknamense]
MTEKTEALPATAGLFRFEHVTVAQVFLRLGKSCDQGICCLLMHLRVGNDTEGAEQAFLPPKFPNGVNGIGLKKGLSLGSVIH